MNTVIEALRPLIPISIEQVKIAVKIPAQFIGKAYGVVRNLGKLLKEEWQADGSWLGVIQIPAGMQIEFYDKLNDLTKGNVETKILK